MRQQPLEVIKQYEQTLAREPEGTQDGREMLYRRDEEAPEWEEY